MVGVFRLLRGFGRFRNLARRGGDYRVAEAFEVDGIPNASEHRVRSDSYRPRVVRGFSVPKPRERFPVLRFHDFDERVFLHAGVVVKDFEGSSVESELLSPIDELTERESSRKPFVIEKVSAQEEEVMELPIPFPLRDEVGKGKDETTPHSSGFDSFSLPSIRT